MKDKGKNELKKTHTQRWKDNQHITSNQNFVTYIYQHNFRFLQTSETKKYEIKGQQL